MCVVSKRILMKGGYVTISELFVHIGTLIIFLILSSLYSLNLKTTRYMPYIYALISYYSHTVFIFKCLFDEDDDPSKVSMTKDVLFRHIIQFAALSFNLIYINVFLVFTRRDCIILNITTFGLFCKDVFMQPGKKFFNSFLK